MSHNSDSDGNPNVFNVERNKDGKSWLNNDVANPDNRWNLDNRILFRIAAQVRPAQQEGL